MQKRNYILIFLLILYTEQIKSIIVLPFQVTELKEEDAKMNYTANDFFSDFLHTDFYSSINITYNNIKILTRITPDNYTFFLSEEECKRKSVDNAQNYLIITRYGYKINDSKHVKNISKFSNNLTNYKNGGIISEGFTFYNTTKLKCQYLSYNNKDDKDLDTQINIEEMKIIIEEYTYNKTCAVIGLGKPRIELNEGIHFINELKRIKAINDYSFTYKFITSTSGQLIIGGLPHDYYEDSKFYKNNQFIKINSNSPNDYNFPWSISFNKIFLEKENKEKIYFQNNVKSYIVSNLGFIIGTTLYKKSILENYFNSLINEGICTLDKINNVNNNFVELNIQNFEIFSCDVYQFNVGHKSSFPSLKFQQNDYNYTFSFHYYYLFKEFKERYYFLVIFPDEQYQNNDWYLGLPFLKVYQFIFNYDSKTIGFYNENLKEKNTTIDIETNNDENTNNNSYMRIVIEVVVAIILVGLIFVAFIIGQKINNQRKKRANEMQDDNFEYFAKDNNNAENPLNI